MSEGTISLSLEQLDEPGARMRGRRVEGAGLQAALLLSSQQGLEPSSLPWTRRAGSGGPWLAFTAPSSPTWSLPSVMWAILLACWLFFSSSESSDP